jgi:hypothetical protein
LGNSTGNAQLSGFLHSRLSEEENGDKKTGLNNIFTPMSEELKYFLENTKVDKLTVENKLRQPVLNIPYPKRLIFDKLEKYAFDFLNHEIEPRFISLATTKIRTSS